MKRVSFKVAKAIKDAGYPQGQADSFYVIKDTDEFEEGELVDMYDSVWAATWVDDNVVDAPYATEVWLWLWREKRIAVEADYSCANNVWFDGGICGKKFNDPEDVIIAGIEYLVEQNLLK